MRRLIATPAYLGAAPPILLSVGLWAMLWLSISPGNPAAILNPGNPGGFIQGLRAAFPLIAAGASAVIIGVKLLQRSPSGFGFFGPLGLATVYGLTGLVASLNSPDGSVALWWAALYLSVPVILWGVVWGAAPLDQLRRLVDATWLIVILASAVLFVVAALYLDLADKTLNPSQLLRCQPAEWVDLTGGRLRSTGVGRYAALAGIVALSGLLQGRWRPIWLVVLLTSLTLLLYTGARGSFAGFTAGASLVFLVYLVYAGKRVFISASLAMLVLVPLVWSTGVPREVLENCVFRGSLSANIASLTRTQAPLAPTPSFQVLTAPAEATVGDPLAPTPSFQVLTAPAEAAVGDPMTPADELAQEALKDQMELPPVTKEFFKLSGRTAVWAEGWRLFKSSPVIGFGFHADRLLLGTHMHNSVLHALLQAGLIGTIPFIAAMISGWLLFLRIVRKLNLLSGSHKHSVIQCGGVLAFLTMRSLPESTGAFFGVDWLILAPILFYLQVVNYGRQPLDVDNLLIPKGA